MGTLHWLLLLLLRVSVASKRFREELSVGSILIVACGRDRQVEANRDSREAEDAS